MDSQNYLSVSKNSSHVKNYKLFTECIFLLTMIGYLRMYNVNNPKYLELAKLDYNRLQGMHRTEIDYVLK